MNWISCWILLDLFVFPYWIFVSQIYWFFFCDFQILSLPKRSTQSLGWRARFWKKEKIFFFILEIIWWMTEYILPLWASIFEKILKFSIVFRRRPSLIYRFLINNWLFFVFWNFTLSPNTTANEPSVFLLNRVIIGLLLS